MTYKDFKKVDDWNNNKKPRKRIINPVDYDKADKKQIKFSIQCPVCNKETKCSFVPERGQIITCPHCTMKYLITHAKQKWNNPYDYDLTLKQLKAVKDIIPHMSKSLYKSRYGKYPY